MKALLFTISIFIVSTSTYSQVNFGLKAGVAGSNISKSMFLEEIMDFDTRYSFNIGGYMNTSITKKLSIQNEVVYTRRGAGPQHLRYDYLSLPVLLSYNPIPKLALEVGPEIGFYVTQKNNRATPKKTDIGIDSGIRFFWHERSAVGLRYYHGLSTLATINLTDNQGLPIGNIKQKNQSFQLSFSYRLLAI